MVLDLLRYGPVIARRSLVMALLFLLLLLLWLTQVQLGLDLFVGAATTVLRGHFFFLLVCWTAATATLVNLVVTGHSGLSRRIAKVTAAGSFGSHWRYRTAVNSSLQSAKVPGKKLHVGVLSHTHKFYDPGELHFFWHGFLAIYGHHQRRYYR